MPLTTYNFRTKPAYVLLAVRDKLVTDGVFPQERAKISLRMNPPLMALQATSYSIVLPLSQFADQRWNDGAGRFGTALRGRVNVYPRNINASDIAYEAESWLTEPDRGILSTVMAVIDSLQDTFPTDPDGNPVVVEPMRLVFFGEPKQRYEQPEAGDVVVEFETLYVLDLKRLNADGTVVS